MNEQSLFNLYVLIVVSIFAQSLLAWELGEKGLDRLRKQGLGIKIWLAFGFFAIQGIWQRVSDLDFPIKSWKDCWPICIVVTVFLIGRSRRNRNNTSGG
jgi:hypothetical protein